MTTNPSRRRNSNRLQGYDYSQEGAYFVPCRAIALGAHVTICSYHREFLFGEVIDGNMELNDLGKIIQNEWVKSAEIRSEIEIGEFVVKPNHMHGIVWIVNSFDELLVENNIEFKFPSHTLGAMIRGFKSASTKQINQIRNTPGIPVFQRPTLLCSAIA